VKTGLRVAKKKQPHFLRRKPKEVLSSIDYYCTPEITWETGRNGVLFFFLFALFDCTFFLFALFCFAQFFSLLH
jgi:hypothetical protein